MNKTAVYCTGLFIQLAQIYKSMKTEYWSWKSSPFCHHCKERIQTATTYTHTILHTITVSLSLTTRHHFQPFECCLLQRLTEVWVSNADQLVCTLTKCLTKQICNTVLSHYVMDMCACWHYPSTWNIITTLLSYSLTEPQCLIMSNIKAKKHASINCQYK